MAFLSGYGVDLAVLAIVVISTLVAWRRGFVAEILSLAGWFGAGIVALYGFSYARPLAGEMVGGGILADIIAAVVPFLIALALFAFLGGTLSRRIRGSLLGGVDRSLGLLFGALRGALIAVLLYIGVQWGWSGESMPDAISRSRVAPVLEQGTDILRAVVPGAKNTRMPASGSTSDTTGSGPGTGSSGQSTESESTSESKSKSGTGYSRGVRGDMQRLIESKK